MNFSPFGVPLTAALPVATQFTGGKITQSVTTANGQVVGVLQGGENGVHYIRPLDPNAFATATTQTSQYGTQIITLPITMPGAKPGDPQQTVQIQVVNPQPAQVSQANPGNSPKYQISQIPIQAFGQGATVLTVAYNSNQDGIQILDGQNGMPEGMTVVAALQPQDIQLIQAQLEPDKGDKEPTPVALIKSEINKDQDNESAASISIPAQYLQSCNLQEYIQKMQNTALPLSLQQFLKFNTSDIKREQITEDGMVETVSIATTNDGQEHLIMHEVGGEMENEESVDDPEKRQEKEEIQEETAETKETQAGAGTHRHRSRRHHPLLLSRVPHGVSRKGAPRATPEKRTPRKTQARPQPGTALHLFGVHEGLQEKRTPKPALCHTFGEKSEICEQCGKGFYRRDHLRKHMKSHMTRRAREEAEMAQRGLIPKEEVAPDGTAQVTIQVGGLVPVDGSISRVPQHAIQVSAPNEEDNENAVSTVVLPTASEGLSILPN
ncbi:hypothetical protein NQ317_017598 [Molorchus minor]|uniref:C2H2-type domain-containing protein n=1 Tax=Molorchus minor TaxID=1323400 RepID=A0ABQ9J002_9CUCU|nr:hypothetical protein NQ317_017598 [Molorchus minor]